MAEEQKERNKKIRNLKKIVAELEKVSTVPGNAYKLTTQARQEINDLASEFYGEMRRHK